MRIMKKWTSFVMIMVLFMGTTLVFATEGYSPQYTANESVVSLPSDCVDGQVSVGLFGRSLFNELNYNKDTWAEWTKDAGITGDATGLLFTGDGVAKAVYLPSNFNPSTKYGFLYDVISTHANISGMDFTISSYQCAFDANNLPTIVGTQKLVATSKADFGGYNQIRIALGSGVIAEENIKITNIRVFELPAGSEIESDFETMTADELTQKYPYIKGDTVKSTVSTRLTSVGKNLFDKSKIVQGVFRNASNVMVNNSISEMMDIFTRIKPSTVYVPSRFGGISSTYIYYYDIYTNYIERVLLSNLVSITTPENAEYYKIGQYQQGLGYLEDLQLEEGTTSTAYEEYKESISYYQLLTGTELRSLPNLVKDEVTKDGELIQSTDKTLIDGSANFIGLYTSFTNVYRMYIDNYCTTNNIKQSIDNSGIGYCIDGNFDVKSNADLDQRNISFGYTNSTDRLYVNIEKSKVDAMTGATTEDKFKAYLNQYPITLTYQLAQPITHDLPTTPLIGYKNGTLIIDQAVQEAAVYYGGITISDTTLPIEYLEEVNKIENAISTPVDMSQVTIAPDRQSFTINGATDGDTYQYVYTYPSELSTLPTLNYSVPIDITGQVNGNTEMINQNSSLINYIIELIEALRGEVQVLNDSLNQ